MATPVDRFGCINNTVKVASGHYVDISSPDYKSIDIQSIASALGKICRFGGHCPKFYSVAEHCLHAVNLALKAGYTGDALRAVLLHDATEAYVGDVVKPLKVLLSDYAAIEQRFEDAVSQAFGVDFNVWSDVVKRFDRAMLKAEKTAMWPEDTENWTGFSDVETSDVVLLYLTPCQATYYFLECAANLGIK